MKVTIEDWDEQVFDAEDYRAERALQFAALDAMDRAGRCGTTFVVWEQGEILMLKPDETAQYRARALQNLEHLNKRIAELDAGRSGSVALNETSQQP